jgi:hypothetical protein
MILGLTKAPARTGQCTVGSLPQVRLVQLVQPCA